jgi:retron-type reverse transcriptase
MTEDRLKLPHEIFKVKLRIKNLKKIYAEEFSTTKVKGVDRLNSEHFTKQKLRVELKIIAEKSSKGIYRFSPYLENLKGKGREKYPRVLAIPTIRDRIAIYALKEFLFELFPECVHRRFANQYIRDIKEIIQECDSNSFSFFRTDIKDFYGSINHETLIDCLKRKTRSMRAIEMIKRAITRPVVPKVYRRENKARYQVPGIPQGLSISNILAGHLEKSTKAVSI